MFKKKLEDVKLEIPGRCFKVDDTTYYIYTANTEYQMYSQPVASLESFTKSCAFVCCQDTGRIFQLYTNPAEPYSYTWIQVMEGTDQDLLKKLFPSYVPRKIYEDNVYVNINKLIDKCINADVRDKIYATIEQLDNDSKIVVDRYTS